VELESSLDDPEARLGLTLGALSEPVGPSAWAGRRRPFRFQ